MNRVSVENITTAADSVSIAVASAAVVYTKAFDLSYGAYFALAYKAVSATGSPSIKIELEQSWILPTTEGAADANWVVPEGATATEADLTTETQHLKALSPVTMPFGRLKITGSGTNPADTIVTAKISQQQQF
jgi:hypothetical protein